MGLETGTYINDLNPSNPLGTDNISQGDDHIRLIKSVLKNTFPGLAGAFARVQTKSAAYTAVSDDNTSLIDCSAEMTLSLTPASVLGNRWTVVVYARGGDVVIDPSNTELINGQATLTVPQGSFSFIWCNGAGFYAAVIPSVTRTLLRITRYTTPGSGTWVKQPGVTSILIRAVGGGGGGGGGYSPGGGSGGGAGGYQELFIENAATSYLYVVGAGGSGGAPGSGGGNGGNTTIASIVAGGGFGGSPGGNGGSGGSGLIPGGRGDSPYYKGGAGGDSVFGGGGGGGIYGGVGSNGSNGFFGGGGGGGGGGDTFGGAGGAGGAGYIEIWEFGI